MKTILLVATATLLSSCAAMNGVARKTSSTEVLGGGFPPGTSYESLESDLTRSDKVWGHFYVEARLATRGLIEAEERESGQKTMDSEEVINRRITERLGALVKSRTCLLFQLRTPIIESGYFRGYRAKLEDGDGKLHDIEFALTRGAHSVPSHIEAFHHAGFDWWNSSHGCTKKPVDTSKGFKVHFIDPARNGGQTILYWDIKEEPEKAAPEAERTTAGK